jgi:hypothetical protein
VREAAANLRVHRTHAHTRVRNSAVMLLQVLANVLAVRDDAEGADAEEEEEANEVFSLNSIPPCHQFLDCTELEKFGQECVQQLLELLEKLLLALHKLSPSKENAKENAAVTMRKIGERRGNGKELEVRVEGAPSPKKQRRLLEAELLEAKVGALLAFNNICFACKSSGHWALECPFRSPSKPAVQMLVAARATCAEQGGHVARFASHISLRGVWECCHGRGRAGAWGSATTTSFAPLCRRTARLPTSLGPP